MIEDKITPAGRYDAVVCGAGCAGFCAAVQAARAGLRTAVIERQSMPGGIMTYSGNNHVAQFFAHGRQVISGIGWEFIQRLNAGGYAPIPDMSPGRRHPEYGIEVNIPAAAHLIDEMLLEAGVAVYYNQPVVEAESSGRAPARVDSVIISTKTGLRRVEGSMFIDCTGDADVCFFAGAQTEKGDELQPGTVRYYFGGCALDEREASSADALMSQAAAEGRLREPDTMRQSLAGLIARRGCNVNHISGFDGSDSGEKTRADIEGRACVFRIMEAAGIPGLIENIAPETAVRETRRAVCDGYITVEDYVAARSYPDAVCYSFYPVDLHLDGMQPIYQIHLEDGRVPQIPLSAMTVKGFDNLFAAGRCASGDRLANSAYRVKASCMAMGQAAGAAAAVAVKENRSCTSGLCVESVGRLLEQGGAIVPLRAPEDE